MFVINMEQIEVWLKSNPTAWLLEKSDAKPRASSHAINLVKRHLCTCKSYSINDLFRN